MSIEDDPVRDVLAALSYYLGKQLPDSLVGLSTAHQLTKDGGVTDGDALLAAVGDRPRLEVLRTLGGSLRERADEAGIALLVRGDHGWPAAAGLVSVPCLWLLGRADLSTLAHAVTVTGSRAATDEGRFIASDMGGAFAEAGLTVVAGLSVGIDAAAAGGAFEAAGAPPVLVTAGGLDHTAGLALRALQQRTAAESVLLSPFPPGCDPTPRRWDFRDALLGTLSAATVLVQASPTSRGLAAGRAAAASGRLVCAVPGSVLTGASGGCHRLIADGTARLVTGADAVFDALRAHTAGSAAAADHCAASQAPPS